MKKSEVIKAAGIVLIVVVTGVLMHLYGEATAAKKRQQAIAEEIIRLHVIANSDSEEDQNLKLKVKETVLLYLRGAMEEAKTVEEARGVIRSHLPMITEIAEEKIQAEGYDYEVDTRLEYCYFPVKEYGTLTFPAGDYEALRVKIGDSQGKNWWCVMYPSLCFVDSVQSNEKLQTSLTEEEYTSLLDGEEEVSYGFWLFDWL